MALRVLIADDQAMVRAGFRMILEAESDIEVVGEAKDGEEALAAARRVRPDVVAAPRRLLDEPGSTTRVVIVTTFDDDENLYEALRAGAGGFLLKNAPPERLVEAVRTVAAGGGPGFAPGGPPR